MPPTPPMLVPELMFNKRQLRAIEAAARLISVGVPAVTFVAQHTFMMLDARPGKSIAPQAMIAGIPERAASEWGLLARWTLETMGIHSYRTVARIIAALVASKLLSDSPDHTAQAAVETATNNSPGEMAMLHALNDLATCPI